MKNVKYVIAFLIAAQVGEAIGIFRATRANKVHVEKLDDYIMLQARTLDDIRANPATSREIVNAFIAARKAKDKLEETK